VRVRHKLRTAVALSVCTLVARPVSQVGAYATPNWRAAHDQ